MQSFTEQCRSQRAIVCAMSDRRESASDCVWLEMSAMHLGGSCAEGSFNNEDQGSR